MDNKIKYDPVLDKKYMEGRKYLAQSGTHESIKAAKTIFEELGDYKDCVSLVKRCNRLLSFEKGNIIEFGAYNGKPIKWRVVESIGKNHMLIAEEPICKKHYNEERVNTFWDKSTIRKWLNEEFIYEIFSPEELQLVEASKRTTEANHVFYTDGCDMTLDKLFIPSKNEIDKYLPNVEDRARGEWWWLRNPGDNLLAVEAVSPEGEDYVHGINVNSNEGMIRPAVCVFARIR
ncbi:MAG: DUF6273 domain-containing protein [Clostridia bacterium]|nr:DUF6273 domain-containing protein [Clostridia bacterium]